MARLILVRHGQSVANAERRFTHGPDEPLTPLGREQARTRAARLRGSFAPVALCSSPFVRALDTARLIGEVLGLAPRVLDDLREQHFGELHGAPYTSYSQQLEQRTVSLWELRPPGGETLREVVRRAGAALDQIAVDHAGQDVVVVSHGGVMAALRARVAGDFETSPVSSPNADGYVLEYVGGATRGPFPLDADPA